MTGIWNLLSHFQNDEEAAASETRATAAWALRQLLLLLHSFMPFISEELWEKLSLGDGGLLINADWPAGDAAALLQNDHKDIDWIVRLISQVRSVRAEMNVPPSAMVPLMITKAGEMEAEAVSAHGTLIMRLARLSALSLTQDDAPEGAAQDVLDSVTLIFRRGCD